MHPWLGIENLSCAQSTREFFAAMGIADLTTTEYAYYDIAIFQ